MSRILNKAIVSLLAVAFSGVVRAGVPSFEVGYLWFNGIEGESTDAQHLKWIDALDWSFDTTNGVFTFKHLVDRTTPRLQQFCANGSRIPSGKFDIYRSIGGVRGLECRFSFTNYWLVHAVVATEELGGDDFRVVETVTCRCESIVEDTSEQKLFAVTLPDLSAHHLSATWTSQTQTEPQAIVDDVFAVFSGTSNVVVRFAATSGYLLDGPGTLDLGNPEADIVVPEADLPTTVFINAVVTVERREHMSAFWTSGAGTVTNAIAGASFEVEKGTTGVKVIFVPEHCYRFESDGETGVRELDSPLAKDCVVTPPEVEGIPGTVVAPWDVGEDVVAYVKDDMTLVIEGSGAMTDFANAEDVPWNEVASEVKRVEVGKGVTHIGENAFAALPDTAVIELSVSFGALRRALGVAEAAAGAISGAEFAAVEIVDGKARLDVSVYTNSKLTATIEGWGFATNDVIVVPAPDKQGFFYLMSKPAVPSDKGGVPFQPTPRLMSGKW